MMLRTPRGPLVQCRPHRASISLACWVASLLLAIPPGGAFAASSPYRGLWAGQVVLNYVNEVPVPLDENNQPVAPDPKVATPTADQAHLRLILHVDGAGQVRLLRDVAVLVRGTPANIGAGGLIDIKKNPGVLGYQTRLAAQESDMSLVTDERLYGAFPAQAAFRIASAVFDFGDGRATDAVRAVIAAASTASAESVQAFPSDMSRAETAAKTAAMNVVQHSDVAAAFGQFLSTSLTRTVVDDIATGNATALATARTAAAALLTASSFFPDLRGSNLVEALYQVSLTPGATPAQKRKIAQNTAAAHADLTEAYPRFLAGKEFGDLIAGGAAAAGRAAVVTGATAGTVLLAVNGDPAVRAAQTVANSLAALSAYTDTRAPDAAALVITAVVAAAVEKLPAAVSAEKAVTVAASDAGLKALAENVIRYRVPAVGPTTDYNTFVKSTEYTGSSAIAATASAKAAVEARAINPFLTLVELKLAASDAATDALRAGDPNTFKAAAGAARRELPLEGAFGPGLGDPRFSFAIKTGKLAPLGPPALVGTFHLPASHPTNPFRHRRHPDHRFGIDVERSLRLDFDGTPVGSVTPPGFGVNRITGVYREELFGLHKPLGPNKDTGLRVEGRFELNRISQIDALNAQ